MKRKRYAGGGFKLAAEPGSFVAVFSRFNVIDADGDVTVPGAFTEGEAVRIAAWGHDWGALPVGRGEIHERDDVAVVEGRFFMETDAGREHYETVKALGDLQEWSFGYAVLKSDEGTFQGEQVRFLRKLRVHEVSPVLIGAGVDTGTERIKRASGDSWDPAYAAGIAAELLAIGGPKSAGAFRRRIDALGMPTTPADAREALAQFAAFTPETAKAAIAGLELYAIDAATLGADLTMQLIKAALGRHEGKAHVVTRDERYLAEAVADGHSLEWAWAMFDGVRREVQGQLEVAHSELSDAQRVRLADRWLHMPADTTDPSWCHFERI